MCPSVCAPCDLSCVCLSVCADRGASGPGQLCAAALSDLSWCPCVCVPTEAPLDLASSAPLLCEPPVLSVSAGREEPRLTGGGGGGEPAGLPSKAVAAAAALSVSAELEQLHQSMALASLPAPPQAYEVALAAAVAAATSTSSMFQHSTHSPGETCSPLAGSVGHQAVCGYGEACYLIYL